MYENRCETWELAIENRKKMQTEYIDAESTAEQKTCRILKNNFDRSIAERNKSLSQLQDLYLCFEFTLDG